MGIYEVKERDIFDFARHVNAQTRTSGDEIQFKLCPYCKGGHARHDTWTFAINKTSGAFNCKRNACGIKGNMIDLSRDFDFSLGRDVDEYFKPKKRYRTFKQFAEPIIPKEPAINYLMTRGISEDTAKKYEITTQKDKDNILVFPFFDDKGILQFIKYRKTDFEKGKDRAKEWCEKNCKPILFGMKQCNLNNPVLVCAEGQLDSLSIAEAGIENAVSVPIGCKGFTWIPYCWDWLQNFETIIVFGDHENGHITLLDEFSRRFGQKIKHVRVEDYKDCKDANEILQKYGKVQVAECILNAVSVPVKRVVDLADVEDIDIFQLKKVQTGIKQLDRLLYGGLPFGGVHLITAKAGSGKSTLASQIIIQARHQGYKCFAYSGELPNYLFKAWMTFQVAGRRCVFEYENPNTDYKGFSLSNNNKKLISEWFRDYIYLYDNSVIEGDESEGLLHIIEKVIQQYGVKVILLDNLMTAMIMDTTEGSNEYAKQTDFVNKLRVIAVRYDVMIILIAHMRKNNFEKSSNDEVAGSSNITNLAMLTISYERGNSEMQEDQRLIRLLKNRLFGKLNFDGIPVDYDEKSKRIYGQGDDLDFDYGFDPNSDGFMEMQEEMVFDD